MAVIKETSILTVELKGGQEPIDAKKKTALNLGDYTGWTLSTPDGKTLIVKKSGSEITINNASGLRYIYSVSAKDYVDIIATGAINYSGENLIKKNKVTGSNYNDTFNYSEDPEVTQGLTINAGKGNDTITGSKFDDKITGGAGRNIVNYAKGNGNDVITLTKGENFTLNMTDLNLADLKFEIVKKDLKISYNKDGKTGSVTLKNYAGKDVTNNKTKKTDDTSSVIMNTADNTVDLRADLYLTGKDKITVNKKYTGSWLSEEIDASAYDNPKNKGLTIDGKGGNDIITGTKYNDTIKAGTGIDEITGAKGDDKLYGGTSADSKTTFVFREGDGADIVNSGKGSDTLCFENIDPNSLTVEQGVKKGKKDMIIKYGDGDSVTVKNYYTVDKNGNITGVNQKNSVKNIIYKMNNGDDIIYLGSGETTVKVDLSMFAESEWSTEEYKDYIENSTKTIYLDDDSILTLDFDEELFNNGLGVFCRGTGQDKDLYISMSNAADPGYGIVIKDYFDADGNPKTDRVKFNIWEYPTMFATERVQTTYTVSEWANETLIPWERVFDVQPFGPYIGEIHGTNMPNECLLYSAGFGDDTIYGGNNNRENIYLHGGKDTVYANEGNKNISIWGNQTNVDLYLGSKPTTTTNIHLGLVEGNVTSNINTAGDLNVSWDCYADTTGDIYTSTLKVDKWNTRSSIATISMGGNNRDNTLNAIDGIANIIDGGSGDDTLIGGTGADTFNFIQNEGYGIDTVKNYTSDDVLRFESASSYGVDFTKFKYYTNNNGKGLVIRTKDLYNKDSYVIVDNYFESANKIDTVTTKNWSTPDETKSLATMYGNKADLGSFEVGNGGEYTGTDKEDVLIGKSGENTLTGGKGDDTLYTRGGNNTFVFNAGDGSDILYQEGGTVTLKFNDATIYELASKTGYDKDTTYYDDLLIHYDGENTLRVKDYYYTSRNNTVKIIDSTGTEYNMADYFKPVKYINSVSDFYTYPATNKDDDIRILSDNLAIPQIAGKKGSDRIWGSNADEEIFSHKTDYSYDTTPGVVDEIHAGGGDDVVYAWSDTNIVYGDAGDDWIFVNVGQKSIVSDSSGNDVLSINPLEDGSDVADYDKMHFVFNVDKDGIVDDAGLRILTDDEFALWQTDTNYAGIKGISIVKDYQGNGGYNCIETFIDAKDNELSMSKIEAVKNDIASWLSDNGYTDVNEVLTTSTDPVHISTLVAKFDVTAQWTLV